jgi:integrase
MERRNQAKSLAGVSPDYPPAGALAHSGEREKKIVAANQAAIDALPAVSGDWSVKGIPGLIVRCRAQVKSYVIQRRIRGALVKRTLGEMSLKAAKAAAMKEWARLKPKPPGAGITLGEAWRQYLNEKPLAETTKKLYGENLDRYLDHWRDRALETIGSDRAGLRARYHELVRDPGKATAASVMRTLAAVYRYQRRVNPDLPECPTIVIDLPRIKPRDWALSPEELCEWWAAVQRLGPVKRAWWLTCLLTGARRGSVEALRWADVDWEKKMLLFGVAKGGRPYIVPAADRLLVLLREYREKEAPPSEWVFPSRARPDQHLKKVRDDKRGLLSPHHLRHTYRTTLAQLGVGTDQARMLMGHSLGGDVSRDYITAALVVESLRPLSNAVADRYAEVIGWEA